MLHSLEPPTRTRTPRYQMVAVAASAGGVAALSEVIGSLPPGFPLPVVIVQHRTARLPHLLGPLLARRTHLRVKTVEEGEPLQPGTVYVAPPDLHVVVSADRTLRLHNGTRIRHVLSSANPLFESAALATEGAVIAVVLTGSGHDGTDGVQAVKAAGGFVVVQEPSTAEYRGMPSSAVAAGAVDEVLPLARIGPRLCALAAEARE
jgi:two-component system, chemotaxis family, protein-glutamate methylesterase/glutaminase